MTEIVRNQAKSAMVPTRLHRMPETFTGERYTTACGPTPGPSDWCVMAPSTTSIAR